MNASVVAAYVPLRLSSPVFDKVITAMYSHQDCLGIRTASSDGSPVLRQLRRLALIAECHRREDSAAPLKLRRDRMSVVDPVVLNEGIQPVASLKCDSDLQQNWSRSRWKWRLGDVRKDMAYATVTKCGNCVHRPCDAQQACRIAEVPLRQSLALI